MAEIAIESLRVDEVSDPNIIPGEQWWESSPVVTEGQSIDRGWDNAIATLSQPETVNQLQKAGFDLDDIDKQLQNLRSFAKYNQALAKKENEAKIEGQNQFALDSILAGETPNIETILDQLPDLSVTEQKGWRTFAKDHTQSILDDKIEDSPMNLHDPAVYEQLLFTARHSPYDKTVSPNALFNTVKLGRETTRAGKYVAGGITTDQRTAIENLRTTSIEKLEKEKKEEDELRRPAVTRAHTEIDRIRAQNISLFGEQDFDEIRRIGNEYQIVHNRLDAYAESIKENPNFDTLIQQKANDLMTDGKKAAVKSLFERKFPFTFGIVEFAREKLFGKEEAGVSAEPATETEFKAEVGRLKATDIETARDYYDEWKHKW